jgi:D-alanyl-D-alanine carboxypeptidase (penicillin-binding protein 5/6)
MRQNSNEQSANNNEQSTDEDKVDEPYETTPPSDDDTPPQEGNSGFEALLGVPEFNSQSVINAPFGTLYNLTDDVFIYGKRIDERVSPGGAVRLLTALAAHNALSSDFVFTVGNEINMVGEGYGVAGLREEQRLGMDAMLSALLIPLGNDAAFTVAINTARELSENSTAGNTEMNDYFIRLMNDYARRLGCMNSSFSNPNGSHSASNYSTVRDLTIIAAAAASNPLISAICGKPEHSVTFDSGENASWTNSNTFLQFTNWDIRGLRIGYTDESMFSAQILAHINGKAYIATVSGCQTPAERENDILRLLQLARDGYNADIIDVFDS